ncbi:auracyanin family protein [Runella rosea]|uniref:Auracyanin family protein n=1 Tax=Runella rosea TaxID=2259595 RepID=A0A344TKZ6_9BACT|nr:plastocyanin/azurin family copper-binding protein [Runella rosea]AXE19317.1 auracyanin family protein [Runella rosea]
MKKIVLYSFILSFASVLVGQAQNRPMTEEDYYRIVTLPIPENVQLEVGGLSVLPDGRLAASTRRGEVWMINNPYLKGSGQPTYKRFAHGLHEPLGLLYRPDGSFLLSQRGEITHLVDSDGDGVADVYESFYKWPLSGNYHEYSYGPVLAPNGDLLVTLNLDWIGHGASLAKWRGWLLKFDDKANMKPIATGLRSPAGYIALQNGDMFYTENQGDWVGSGRMTHLETGDFAGNPEGLVWSQDPESPVKLTMKDIPDTGEPLYDVAKRVPGLKAPAVWFPHTLMGISTSDIKEDMTKGAFGPFEGQLFVGDQGHSKIMRVMLEKVKGRWQGICFPFREGFQSGILRMVWGLDGSMFVGQTSRGWSATGKDPFGIQRLVWTGQMPFEMKKVISKPDGFEVEFTLPVDKKTAQDPASYQFNSFTYKYHHNYGSPIINASERVIRHIAVSDNGLKARIVLDSLKLGYIHEIKAEGIRSAAGLPLLHNVGYYTLNEIAEGEKIPASQWTVSVSKPADNSMTAHSGHTMPAATSAVPKGPSTAKRNVEQPADWTNGPDQVITLGTVPGLKFDITQVQVKAGSRIKWVFNNNDDMLHNCVIVKPGTANPIGEAAIKLGLKGSDLQYVPKSANVLFHTNILQPETSEAIYFTAPNEPGDYTFLCTFPGHHTLMQGKLKVTK